MVTLRPPSGFTPRTHTTGLGVVPYASDFGTNANIKPNSPNDGHRAFVFTVPTGTCGDVTYNGGSVENQGVVQVVLDFWAGPSSARPRPGASRPFA